MKRFVPVLILLALPASLSAALPTTGDAAWTPMPGVDCYCTDTQGARVEMGEEICLSVGGKVFVAFCGMSQNVPIWRDTGRACVTG